MLFNNVKLFSSTKVFSVALLVLIIIYDIFKPTYRKSVEAFPLDYKWSVRLHLAKKLTLWILLDTKEYHKKLEQSSLEIETLLLQCA